MVATLKQGVLIGATKRRAGVWAGVCVAIYAVTLLRLLATDSFGSFFLITYVGPLVAFLVATVQAYRNGSVALSWLIAGAPLLASMTVRLVWFHHPGIGLSEASGYLIAALFLGTTAHLLGTEAATVRRTAPRTPSRTEKRGLLAILLVTGMLFAVYYVRPLF